MHETSIVWRHVGGESTNDRSVGRKEVVFTRAVAHRGRSPYCSNGPSKKSPIVGSFSERTAAVLGNRLHISSRRTKNKNRSREPHLDGHGDLADLVHGVHAEVCRDAQAAEVVAGLVQPRENEVALALGGPYDLRDSFVRRLGRGGGAALEIAFLVWFVRFEMYSRGFEKEKGSAKSPKQNAGGRDVRTG